MERDQPFNIFGFPFNEEQIINVHQYMRDYRQAHPRQFNGLSMKNQIRLLVGAVFGTGVMTRSASKYAYNLVSKFLKSEKYKTPDKRNREPSVENTEPRNQRLRRVPSVQRQM